MKPQKIKILCPNCGKESVEAWMYPSYLAHHTSRISAGAKTTFHREGEKYEITSGCFECGKSLKELLEIEKSGKLTHEERLKRLREAGMPTRIEHGNY
jgi:protein-arginine kinase activator protein McsA